MAQDNQTGSVRLDPEVRVKLADFCRTDYRTMSNAVNLLVIEALTARGLWQAGQVQCGTEG
jgi:hypothetical protein